MTIFLTGGFCLPSPGIVFKHKQKNPHNQIRESYENDTYTKKLKQILKAGEYPWGICFPKGKHNYSREQLNWTGRAMDEWNQAYQTYLVVYKYNLLFSESMRKTLSEGDYDKYETRLYILNKYYRIHGWPGEKLFVWSCDGSKHNLIFPEIGSHTP